MVEASKQKWGVRDLRAGAERGEEPVLYVSDKRGYDAHMDCLVWCKRNRMRSSDVLVDWV